MDKFVARANIDHYLGILNGADLSVSDRATVIVLLNAEMDLLSQHTDQLSFAEEKLAKIRVQVDHQKNARDGFADGSQEREMANGRVKEMEAVCALLDQFRRRLLRNAV